MSPSNKFMNTFPTKIHPNLSLLSLSSELAQNHLPATNLDSLWKKGTHASPRLRCIYFNTKRSLRAAYRASRGCKMLSNYRSGGAAGAAARGSVPPEGKEGASLNREQLPRAKRKGRGALRDADGCVSAWRGCIGRGDRFVSWIQVAGVMVCLA